MDRLLHYLFKTFIRRGTFRVTTSRGTTFTVGDGSGALGGGAVYQPRGRTRRCCSIPSSSSAKPIWTAASWWKKAPSPTCSPSCSGRTAELPQWARPQWLIRYLGRRIAQFNPRPRARRNVAHHYDLDGRLYSLFLDADRQYSCAYFENPESVARRRAARQEAPPRRQAAARARQTVLDIGCGWGGLGLYLAEIAGADVTGVTLSQEQHAVANERAAEKGLADRRASCCRTTATRKARSTASSRSACSSMSASTTTTPSSANARDLLADDGVMLLHSIGRSEGPGVTNPWIAKYIFPGGYIPALSEVLPASRRPACWSPTSRSCACITPRRSRHWRERFLAHREEVERIYDERFVRMWEFYLAASEMSFREQAMMISRSRSPSGKASCR